MISLQVQFRVQATLEDLGPVPWESRQKEDEALQGRYDVLIEFDAVSDRSAQVRFNVQAALEGLRLVASDGRQKEDEALQEVQEILRPIMNTTWPSGRPENS